MRQQSVRFPGCQAMDMRRIILCATFLALAACSRLAQSVDCRAVRQLRFGMNEAQVEQILGRPISAWRERPPVTRKPEVDQGWSYHDWLFGKVPSSMMACRGAATDDVRRTAPVGDPAAAREAVRVSPPRAVRGRPRAFFRSVARRVAQAFRPAGRAQKQP